jgi:hypothetical protein
LPAHSRIHDVISIVHTKQFRGKGENIRPLYLPVLVDDMGEWEVESIDRAHFRKGKAEFLIRWKGYFENERTWEPGGEFITRSGRIAALEDFTTRSAFPRISRSRDTPGQATVIPPADLA